MDRWTETDQRRLVDALASFDRPAVAAAAERFAGLVAAHGGEGLLERALTVLKALHRKRHIDLVQRLAESLLRNGLDHHWVRYHYALALLDDDRLAAAEALLMRLDPEVITSNSDVRGAIGRVHKVRYLTGRADDDLGAAVNWYRSTYLRNPELRYYHGVNAAAMLLRAAEDGVPLPDFADPLAEAQSIATQVLDRIAALDEPDMWQLASAAEACLVLRRPDAAFAWLSRYVASPAADAFEIGSTLRQFEQVHQLAAGVAPGRQLLPLLRSRLLQCEGGRVVLDGAEAGVDALQRLDEVRERLTGLQLRHSNEQFHSIGWLKSALSSCRAVARIENRHGDGVGTGFLLDGKRVAAGLPDRVLLTNAHVIPDFLDPEDECYVTFRGNDDAAKPVKHRVGPVLWTSPPALLDATVLVLLDDPDPAIEPLRIRRTPFPEPADQRAYVIGYPKGVQDVSFSLHDTKMLDRDDRVAHYRSPTEDGNSGSPVFDSDWSVIALHHRGDRNMLRLNGKPGTYEANEGIRMDRIRAELRAIFGDPSAP